MDQPSQLHVEFYSEPVENPAKSREQGRPIYEDKEFVRIKYPGDKQRIHVAPANEGYRRDPATNRWVSYKEDYPRHYEAFQANTAYIGEGTPLAELPFLSESKRAELRALNIHTAEQLSGLDGSFLTKLGMGGRALKDQATAWLEKAAGSAVDTKLAAQNAALTEELERMRAEMQQFMQSAPKAPALEADAFEGYSDDDLKNMIRDATGSLPRGNPKRETLISMLADIQKEAA